MIKLKINPKNPTEIWGTFDGREPDENNCDFGADFWYRVQVEPEVVKAVSEIVVKNNEL